MSSDEDLSDNEDKILYDTDESSDSDDNDKNNEDIKKKEENVPEEHSDDERKKIRSELSNMSFEDLMKLKDNLGAKVYNEAMFGKTEKRIKKKRQVNKDFRRENKNRPREMSSKRTVPLMNKGKPEAEQVKIDPRFDPRYGEFDRKSFDKSYNFVNEIREKEIAQLKEKFKECTDEDLKSNLKFSIQRLENQHLEYKKRKDREMEKNQEYQDFINAKQEGKAPRFANKQERKAKDLVKKYLELKSSGRLEKHLEKRRKKNVAKDRKKLFR